MFGGLGTEDLSIRDKSELNKSYGDFKSNPVT